MNSRNQQPAVDLAEVASEVVRVMFQERLNQSSATRVVLCRKGLDFTNALEIASMALKIFELNPEIQENVRLQRPINSADAIDQWQKRMEYGT